MRSLSSRRRFLSLGALASGAAVLAACGATSAPAATATTAAEAAPAPAATATAPAEATTVAATQPVAAEEKTQLRVSHWWGERLDAMMQAFGDANPDVELLPEPKPWNGYHDALLTQLAGGVGADVYLVSMAYFPQIVRKGSFLALDEFMAAIGFDPAKEFVVDPTPAYSWNGQLYGVDAWTPGSVYIVCNLDLFAEAGVEAPIWGSDSFDEWKFEDLHQAAIALTKKADDGTVEQWGLSNPGSWQGANNQYAWQNGGDWFDTPNYQDETKCIIDSPECIEAYEFLVNMHFEDGVTPTATQAEMLGDDVFLSGRVAMVHSWMIYSNFAPAEFEWAVIPVPWETKKASQIGGGNNWSIYKDSQVGAVGWRLINYITTEYDAYEQLVHTVMPSCKPERFFDLLEPKERECWEVQLSRTKNEYWKPSSWGSRAPSQYNDIYVAWMDRVYQGEIGVSEALAGIAKETNELIDKLIAESGG